MRLPLFVALLGALAVVAGAASGGDPGSGPITLVVGGDVLLGRGVAKRAGAVGWRRVTEAIRPALSSADIAIVNLESPVGACLPEQTPRYPRLCGEAEGITALSDIGVDAVTLANNHSLDAGPEGLRRTASLLRAHRIVPLGTEAAAGRVISEPLGPVTVVSANLTGSRNPPLRDVPRPSPDEVGRVIRAAKQGAPHRPVLVLLHAGREGDPSVPPGDAAYASRAVEAGAAAVVMHGAHVVRPLVFYGAVPVHFGLGNLLFDQRRLGMREGELVSLSVSPEGIAARRITAPTPP